jgi:hypothetical protein
MATPTIKPGPQHTPDAQIPPLKTGDRLSREEFERRYDAMPDLKKAELIEGVVYVSSPVRQRSHGRPHCYLTTWLGTYEISTPGVEVGSSSSARLDMANEPQPDGLLFIDPDKGGQVQLSPDDYIEGSPELVAEVSASTVRIDLNEKLIVYRRTGAKEYIVWRVLDREVDWFVVRGNQFERLAPDPRGIFRSTVFPGLWLDALALVRGAMVQVMAVLQQGLASPEHAAFVARLNPLTARP